LFKYTSIHTGVCLHGKWLVYLLLVLGGLCIVGLGCGKKSPPVPPERPVPPVVQDLRHAIQGERVELRWTLPAVSDGRAAEIKVLRATQTGEEIGCEGCPLRFRVAAEIPIHHKAFAKSEPRTLYYTETIDTGYRYIYTVIVFDKYGIGGKESNIVKFDH
jgi:hypothetical protein